VSDAGGEKRFDATPGRRDRARRDGNVARSHEIAAIAGFGGALLGLTAVLPRLAGAAAAALRAHDAGHALVLVMLAFVPAACAAAGGTGVALAQSGGLHVRSLTLAFDKLAPLPGLRRMFGAEAAVCGARAIVAFIAVSAVVVPVAVHAMGAASAIASPLGAAGIARAALLQTCFSALAVGALFAFADYGVVRMRWLHSLKMTFDELKRDAREQDGDPQAKSRRKQLHRTLVRGGIARTRDASFVVVNPTHIAIAIRYAPPVIPVPEILVRAGDALALEVRALAERAAIPIVEDRPLARLLWNSGVADRPIPPETFVAVALTIAALMREGVLSASERSGENQV
jgi:flagellar biosynthesis protein FlhB